MQLCRLAPPGRIPPPWRRIPADQAHEFIHEVAMKPRRTKRMLGNHPSRREDDEIDVAVPGISDGEVSTV